MKIDILNRSRLVHGYQDEFDDDEDEESEDTAEEDYHSSTGIRLNAKRSFSHKGDSTVSAK